MPFINETSRREFDQSAKPAMNDISTFGETFDASWGLFVDESLSISSAFNRENAKERNSLIHERIADGSLNRNRYVNRRGRVNYELAARDLNDPAIKTKEVLDAERKEMLKKRRVAATDVISKGSGLAQFAGIAAGSMVDPLVLLTLPLSVAPTTARALSVGGRALLTARNAAAINTATELAIQPLVYEHKMDIESPYGYKDALAAIGGAAIGGAVLGGAMGGLSGYLKKVRGAVEETRVTGSEVPDGDVGHALNTYDRMISTLDSIPRPDRRLADAALSDYDKVIKGEYKSFVDAAENTVKEMEAEILTVRKEGVTLKQFIQEKGGIDRAIAEAEGIDPAAFKHGGSKPLFRKSGGRTPDEIAEQFNELGFRGGRLMANDVVAMMRDISNGLDEFMDASNTAKVDFAQRQIDALTANTDNDYLKGVYRGAIKQNVQSDIDILESLEVARIAANKPNVTPGHFKAKEITPAQKALTTPKEADILERHGFTDDYNMDIQKFNEIEKPLAIIDDEVVDATAVMKGLDDELAGLESIMGCKIGQ